MARNVEKEFRVEDVIPDSQTIVLMTKDGYIKRIDPDTFKLQSRGGKGVAGLTTKEEDSVESIFSSSTHQDLMFFTSRGRVFKLKVYEIPEASRTAKGQAIVNFLELSPGESITATISSNELNTKQYIVMATRSGTIKKTEIKDFENVRRSGLIAIKLKSGDALEWVRASSEGDDVMLATANGMAIRFNQGDIRQMGRVSAGVRGIKMKGDDQLIGMALLTPKQIADGRQFMVISENGYGKRTNVKEYKAQKRGGTGIKTGKITAKTGKLVSARIVKQRSSRDLLVISQAGQVIRMGVNSVSSLGRATQGVRVMRFKKAGDSVSSVAFVRTEIAEDAVSGDTGLKSIEKRKTVKK